MKTIQSIDKAILILNYVAQHNGTCTLTDISTALNMKITTLHGIIATLEYGEMLSKHPSTNKYTLGIKLFEFGKIYEANLSIKDLVRPLLEELGDNVHETIHLAIPFENQILYIDKVESPYPLRLTSMVGTRESASDSAIGLAILSHLPTNQLKHFIKAEKSEEISKQLQTIKSMGYCIKYEQAHDFYCLATPLIDSHGLSVGGISVVIPKCRYSENLCFELVGKLMHISQSIKNCI